MDLNYPEYNENGKIPCQYCGKEYLIISHKHLATHNKTLMDYKADFPDCPINSKQMAARQKFREDRGDGELFKSEMTDSVIEIDTPEVIMNDSAFGDDDISDIKELIKHQGGPTLGYPNPLGNIMSDKIDLLNFLMKIYPTITNNYFVEKFTLSGHLEFSLVTDITDPVSKTIFDFPRAFWHNTDGYPNVHKHDILKKEGWKIIIIKDKNPKPQTLSNILDIVTDV